MHHVMEIWSARRRDTRVEALEIVLLVIVVPCRKMRRKGSTLLVGKLVQIWRPEMHRAKEILYARRRDTSIVILVIVLPSIVARCRRENGLTLLVGRPVQILLLEMHPVKEILCAQRGGTIIVMLVIVLVSIVAR